MRSLLFIFLFGLCHSVSAGGPVASFTENKGQWPEQVLYRALIPGGALFVERDALTYVIRTGDRRHEHGQIAHDHVAHDEPDPKVHAWRVHFEGGSAQAFSGSLKQPHYENYFLGNDQTAWGTGCAVFAEVLLTDVWPGIDLKLNGVSGLKYDLIVAPGHDPASAQLRFEGQDALFLKDGDLHVQTSAGTVIEKAPIVFNIINGSRARVGSRYELIGSTVSFMLPDGYDATAPLIIDPDLSFSSYSGSTADNLGFTATYDSDGHLYGGGVVFGAGYPITLGALDPTFNGGSTDVGVSKWSPDGSTLVWSTYIGGFLSEAPHSLVVNSLNELYIFGSTASDNFPTTSGCFDPGFNGGQPLTFPSGYNFAFNNGADIFIAHLNVGATALIGSTYFGGSGSDGLNIGEGLFYNYGDPFRGEIALDADDFPLLSTCTSSSDLPTTPGASQSAYGGGQQDAYFLRMDPELTTLLWGTYHGGGGHDSGFGLQVASTGEIYTTGGTTSNDLPSAGSPESPSNSGGIDGYIARFDPSGTMLSTTYVGTPAYDQSFFVQLDTNDDVYVVGQTRGDYPITPGKYAVPGSTQFIHKFDPALSTSLWSTQIGSGSGEEDISPSAFLVSDCGQIYFSGWAGNTNNNGTPEASTTLGLPTTPGAFMTETNGSDFYLMVLQPEADALHYATFFGGTSPEHVDGGTSRFDKNGTVYQAVCAGCGGSDDFPTTPGAWSNTNNSMNCNLGVFKFDLEVAVADIAIDGPNEICFPSDVQFINNSTGGNSYLWDFGDGGTSTEYTPVHNYTEEGVFTVSMIMTDTYGCTMADTASIQVISVATPVASVEQPGPLCPGGSVLLQASEGDNYVWSPSDWLDDPTSQTPTATPPDTITYSVIVINECGQDTASLSIVFSDPIGSAGLDTITCAGTGISLAASGGGTYNWQTSATLSDLAIATPIATPLELTEYIVEITTPEGCTVVDSVVVEVFTDPPFPALADTLICLGEAIVLIPGDAQSYSWAPAPGIVDASLPTQSVSPDGSTSYVVELLNVCGSTVDSMLLEVVEAVAHAWPDTLICPGDSVMIHADGGVQYQWDPVDGLADPTSASTLAVPPAELAYTATVTDENGCTDTAQLQIFLRARPPVDAGPDHVIDYGDVVLLQAIGNGSVEWAPDTWLEDPDSETPTTRPEESILYTVSITDEYGCKNTDDVWVILNGSLFVPNTFTPNGDGTNDLFGAWGKDIAEFRVMVFNRWGELIYEGDHLDSRWDGTYQGVQSPIDTYVWRIDVKERAGKKRTLFGHVNLVR